jgi:hypothetical protein
MFANKGAALLLVAVLLLALAGALLGCWWCATSGYWTDGWPVLSGVITSLLGLLGLAVAYILTDAPGGNREAADPGAQHHGRPPPGGGTVAPVRLGGNGGPPRRCRRRR